MRRAGEDPRPRRLPRGLLGMLGLIVLAESFIARRDLDFLTGENWSWRLTRLASEREARGCRVLCFGDSLVKFGVLPRAIERVAGGRAYNLALCAGQPSSSYFVLRRALAAGARPSAVVVDFWGPLLRVGPRQILEQWPFLLDLRDAADLAWTARDPALFATIAAGLALPSARCRFAIRSNIMQALGGVADGGRELLPQFFRNWDVNEGAQVMPGTLPDAVDLDAYVRGFYPAWRCTRLNAAYIGRFLALAAAHDIPVYWVLPPILPDLQARLEQTGYDAAALRALRAWQARFPNLIVVDSRRSRYDPRAFMDANHLRRDGAYVHSLDLGLILRDDPRVRLAGPRWVELPAYRERPVSIVLEDVVESRMALGPSASQGRR
jgi:hypothetical protein